MEVIVAALCGFLSGLGIGGGSLLMVYLTAAAGLDPRTAGAVNLLYFLPAAGVSLIFHSKNRFVDWRAARWAILGGVILAALGAWISSAVSASRSCASKRAAQPRAARMAAAVEAMRPGAKGLSSPPCSVMVSRKPSWSRGSRSL